MKPTSRKATQKPEADAKAKRAKAPKTPESREGVPQEADAKEPALASSNDRLQRDLKELAPQLSRPIKEAVDRWGERRIRLSVKVSGDDEETGTQRIKPGFGGNASFEFMRMDAFGTPSGDFAAYGMCQLANVARRHGQSFPTEQDFNAALAVVDGVRPENEIEAMLAMQMFIAHASAMEMMEHMRQATTREAVQNYSTAATKMMRTFIAQVEALNKLRKGGEQTVRVEHVHVHPGGQAIVGPVTHLQGGGGTHENGHQAHAPVDPQALAFTPGAPVLCSDPQREAVSVASGEGKGALSDARRVQGKRRTKRSR
jgi:hypothetical protein